MIVFVIEPILSGDGIFACDRAFKSYIKKSGDLGLSKELSDVILYNETDCRILSKILKVIRDEILKDK